MQKKNALQWVVATGAVVVNVYGIYALARDVTAKVASRGTTAN
jgi:hypothetical protein